MISIGTNALASSIILVCRPRPDDAPVASRRDFVRALRRELPQALQEMQAGNIAPVDMQQAAIGPGMGVYSRYGRVLEPDGSPLTVGAALAIINEELDAFLSDDDIDADADTRFAMNWFAQHGFEAGDFGQADLLARAKNTSVAGVVRAGLITSSGGKVQLRHWDQGEGGADDWDRGWDPRKDARPTVWECTHHLIFRLQTFGEAAAARLLARMDDGMAGEARQLAYRLFNICERQKWSKAAQQYNDLVIAWPSIAEQAAEERRRMEAGDDIEQLELF